MKKTDIVFTVVELDGLEKDVRKDAASIVKTRNVIETVVRVSMAVCKVIMDTDVNKVLYDQSRKKTKTNNLDWVFE